MYVFYLDTERLLASYLDTIDISHAFPIPPTSSLQPILQFEQRHLQKNGLINRSNTCCHLSLILCFHRMGLLYHFEGDQIAAGENVLDWPALVLSRILQAMPSILAFYIQNFITAWNDQNRAPRLQSNDDLSITDGILRQLPLSGRDNVPALTQYLATFECFYCGHVDQNCPQWNEKPFSVVPSLSVPQSHRPISVENLLDGFLQLPMMISCPHCNERIPATWKVVPGLISVLYLNRVSETRGITRTRLQIRDPTTAPQLDFLGELVSVISRAADNLDGGHFTSYHQVGGQWFYNDDSRILKVCNFHPFERPGGYETVDLLCYLNN